MKKSNLVIFLSVLFLAAALRIYNISNVPPALFWDEASVGVNSWYISLDGRDEWGEKFPVAFKSFEEYKNPVHIYATAFFIRLFGLNDFAIRLPSVVAGVALIALFFFVCMKFFKKNFFCIDFIDTFFSCSTLEYSLFQI